MGQGVSDNFEIQQHEAAKLGEKFLQEAREYVKRLRFAGFKVDVLHDEIIVEIPNDKYELFIKVTEKNRAV